MNADTPRPKTFRDLQKWLKTLTDAQLDTPILVTPGADDFGGTEYVAVLELATVASGDPRISGGYEGPVLIVAEVQKERQEGTKWSWGE